MKLNDLKENAIRFGEDTFRADSQRKNFSALGSWDFGEKPSKNDIIELVSKASSNKKIEINVGEIGELIDMLKKIKG